MKASDLPPYSYIHILSLFLKTCKMKECTCVNSATKPKIPKQTSIDSVAHDVASISS